MRKINLDAERLFENEKALGGDARASQSKFYWATGLDIEEYSEKVFAVIQNKKVLELGCASGLDAVSFCRYASHYTGVDISDEAINKSQERGLDNAEFVCTDGHKIPFSDGTFDCVIVDALLHHMDLETTFLEISRVLKDDGKLLFKEPLGTNPIFQFYRFLTPQARTEDERPFSFDDLKLMRSYFDLEHVSWFGFTNIFSAFLRIPSLRFILSRLDAVLSKTPVKYFFWQFAGIAKIKK